MDDAFQPKGKIPFLPTGTRNNPLTPQTRSVPSVARTSDDLGPIPRDLTSHPCGKQDADLGQRED